MGLNSIGNIAFCDTDTANIEASIISIYESLVSKKLYPGDPVRLFLEALAQIIIQQRIVIDFTGKQNLLGYASGQYLDHLVALVGVERLSASPARCTIKFTLSEAQLSAITIASGTRVKGGELYFKTINSAQINPGELGIEMIVECEEAGEKGNGLLPGQIDTLVDPFPYCLSISNVSTTTGGADVESDEALRQRAYEAPNSYSCAGSDMAYSFWAKTVSSEIGDVSVISPLPGEVNIIPIGKNGQILSEELLEKILMACTAKNVKPLTDKVQVIQPEVITYDINLEYYIDSSDIAIAGTLQNAIASAVQEYVTWQQSKLGRDINSSELIHKVMSAGAKRVKVNEPGFKTLEKRQVARLNTSTVIYGGVEVE